MEFLISGLFHWNLLILNCTLHSTWWWDMERYSCCQGSGGLQRDILVQEIFWKKIICINVQYSSANKHKLFFLSSTQYPTQYQRDVFVCIHWNYKYKYLALPVQLLWVFLVWPKGRTLDRKRPKLGVECSWQEARSESLQKFKYSKYLALLLLLLQLLFWVGPKCRGRGPTWG